MPELHLSTSSLRVRSCVYAPRVPTPHAHNSNATPPSIEVRLVEGPVPSVTTLDGTSDSTTRTTSSERTTHNETGAILTFLGTVRATEGDDRTPIAALHYEAYEPMAQRELGALAAAAIERHGLQRVAIVHSRGRVAVGEASILIEVRSRHRAEGLRAMTEMLDGLKERVPIWKTPISS